MNSADNPNAQATLAFAPARIVSAAAAGLPKPAHEGQATEGFSGPFGKAAIAPRQAPHPGEIAISARISGALALSGMAWLTAQCPGGALGAACVLAAACGVALNAWLWSDEADAAFAEAALAAAGKGSGRRA